MRKVVIAYNVCGNNNAMPDHECLFVFKDRLHEGNHHGLVGGEYLRIYIRETVIKFIE